MNMNTVEDASQIAPPVGDLIDIINELGDNGDLQSINYRLRASLEGLRGGMQEESVDPSDSPDCVLSAASQAVSKKNELLGAVSAQLDELESLLRV